MADHKYLTSPPKITTMPPGVPYIVGNEAAERFSYYGMNSILTIFMTKYLFDKMGHLSVMQPANAEAWYHTFVSALYFLPIFAAIIADARLQLFLFFHPCRLRLLDAPDSLVARTLPSCAGWIHRQNVAIHCRVS